MTKKTKPICPECGSDDIKFDAWISWNVIGQNWEVANEFDNGVCEVCAQTSQGDFNHALWVDADLEPAPLPQCQQPRLQG